MPRLRRNPPMTTMVGSDWVKGLDGFDGPVWFRTRPGTTISLSQLFGSYYQGPRVPVFILAKSTKTGKFKLHYGLIGGEWLELGEPESMNEATDMADIHSALLSLAGMNPREPKGSSRPNISVPSIPPLPEWQGLDVYDPRLESVRAVARGSGSFGIAVGHYVGAHTPQQIIQRSYERYFEEPVGELIRKRQKYELGLALSRQSGVYRVTLEPTRAGLRYFAWPLAEGVRLPQPHKARQQAEVQISNWIAARRPPAEELPRQEYTRRELSEWLPPVDLFQGREASSGSTSVPECASHKRSPDGVKHIRDFEW